MEKRRLLIFVFIFLSAHQCILANTTVFISSKSDTLSRRTIIGTDQPQLISIDTIGVFGIKNLLKNNSNKLLVLNIWATWCGPCVHEFPDFVKLNQKYKDRNFEWVTISADPPNKQPKVLKFLQKKQGTGRNYIFNSEDLYQLIETVDPRWQGVIPYTLIIAPGGKIWYAEPGVINPKEINGIIDTVLPK